MSDPTASPPTVPEANGPNGPAQNDRRAGELLSQLEQLRGEADRIPRLLVSDRVDGGLRRIGLGNVADRLSRRFNPEYAPVSTSGQETMRSINERAMLVRGQLEGILTQPLSPETVARVSDTLWEQPTNLQFPPNAPLPEEARAARIARLTGIQNAFSALPDLSDTINRTDFSGSRFGQSEAYFRATAADGREVMLYRGWGGVEEQAKLLNFLGELETANPAIRAALPQIYGTYSQDGVTFLAMERLQNPQANYGATGERLTPQEFIETFGNSLTEDFSTRVQRNGLNLGRSSIEYDYLFRDPDGRIRMGVPFRAGDWVDEARAMYTMNASAPAPSAAPELTPPERVAAWDIADQIHTQDKFSWRETAPGRIQYTLSGDNLLQVQASLRAAGIESDLTGRGLAIRPEFNDRFQELKMGGEQRGLTEIERPVPSIAPEAPASAAVRTEPVPPMVDTPDPLRPVPERPELKNWGLRGNVSGNATPGTGVPDTAAPDTTPITPNRDTPSASLRGSAVANDGAPQRGTVELNPRSQIKPQTAPLPRDATERFIPRGDSTVLPVPANDVAPFTAVDDLAPVRGASVEAPLLGETPHGRVGGGRLPIGKIAGVAGVVAMAVVPGAVTAFTDLRDESRGGDEKWGGAFLRGTRTGVKDVLIAPLEDASRGDYTMAAARVTSTVTMLPIPAYVQAFRTEEIARGIPQAEVERLTPALPPGNMRLGSPNPRLNQIAQLIAYRDQGTQNLMVGSNALTAGIMIYGPGEPGMAMGEGQWVTNTNELLNEQIRSYIAEGGTATGIREALDPQFYREQVFERLRTIVPDRNAPGYTEYPIEARPGMQLQEQFRTGIHNGDDGTPEGRERLIGIANDLLKVNDYNETDMLRRTSYQYSRLGFNIARPEQLVAAGFGPVFNITGRPEDLDSDMRNITRALAQPSGGPDGEQIYARVNPGNDFVASPADIYAALPPQMKAQVQAEATRLAAAAPPANAVAAVAAPTPAVAPAVEPEALAPEIVVTGERYRHAPSSREVGGRLSNFIKENNLMGLVDSNGNEKVEFGELRTVLRDAGVTVADDGRVSIDQLRQALPQLQLAATSRGENQGRS